MTNPNRSKTPLSYAQAGVDIDAGNRLIERIKPIVTKTRRPEVLSGIGGFGGLFELPGGYKSPVLVSGTDGVGTKLTLALALNTHDTVGIDLVAMCVNDVIVTGAEPLFFLDYYATGKLDLDVATSVIKGIANGCQTAGAALIGGETAELPGMYSPGDYDLAGFCVGIVEKAELLDNTKVKATDVLLGLASSGPHSNGYSLIRKVLERTGADPAQTFNGRTLGETLLQPTRIYVPSLLSILKQHPIHALAHITGGGITENLPRVLPKGLRARVTRSSWSMPPIFHWLQEQGNIPDNELLKTFNCGIGMVAIVPKDSAQQVSRALTQAGETVFEIGEIETGDSGVNWCQ